MSVGEDMEIILQIILEPMLFAYSDLAESLIEDKKLSRRAEIILKILCFVVFLSAFFAAVTGAFLLADPGEFRCAGKVLLISGGIVLAIHILISLFCGGNRFVEERRKEETEDREAYEKTEPEPIVRDIGSSENEEEK